MGPLLDGARPALPADGKLKERNNFIPPPTPQRTAPPTSISIPSFCPCPSSAIAMATVTATTIELVLLSSFSPPPGAVTATIIGTPVIIGSIICPAAATAATATCISLVQLPVVRDFDVERSHRVSLADRPQTALAELLLLLLASATATLMVVVVVMMVVCCRCCSRCGGRIISPVVIIAPCWSGRLRCCCRPLPPSPQKCLCRYSRKPWRRLQGHLIKNGDVVNPPPSPRPPASPNSPPTIVIKIVAVVAAAVAYWASSRRGSCGGRSGTERPALVVGPPVVSTAAGGGGVFIDRESTRNRLWRLWGRRGHDDPRDSRIKVPQGEDQSTHAPNDHFPEKFRIVTRGNGRRCRCCCCGGGGCAIGFVIVVVIVVAGVVIFCRCSCCCSRLYHDECVISTFNEDPTRPDFVR